MFAVDMKYFSFLITPYKTKFYGNGEDLAENPSTGNENSRILT